jgi:hypothetical protein
MTDKNHPITPPQWQVDAWCKQALAMGADVDSLFVQAYQAGADQELEACCELLVADHWETLSRGLRTARRTKPPSLKEQALGALYAIATGADDTREFHQDLETIKTALESLPE